MDTVMIESFLTTPEYLISITLALPWGLLYSIPCFFLAKSFDNQRLSASTVVSAGMALALLAGQVLLGIDIFKAPILAANIFTGTVGRPQAVVSACFILSSITCLLGALSLTIASSMIETRPAKSRPAKIRVKAARMDTSHLVTHVVSNRETRARANG